MRKPTIAIMLSLLLLLPLTGCKPSPPSPEQTAAPVSEAPEPPGESADAEEAHYSNPEISPALAEKIAQNLASEDPVIREVWRQIEYTANTLGGMPGVRYLDAEVTHLELAAALDNLYPGEDLTVEAYLLQYRLQPEEPAHVLMAGGMQQDEEGWITQAGSMGDPYLLLELREGQVRYLGTVYPAIYAFNIPRAVLDFLIERDVAEGRDVAGLTLQYIAYSVYYSAESQTIFFHLPQAYPDTADFSFSVTGSRLDKEPGDRVYSIPIEGGYDELTLTVSLPDGTGELQSISIDLLDYLG